MMKFYHGKKHDMWIKGCIPLGQFITKSGHKLDLGIWEDHRNGNPSFAIVYGEEGNQYISGTLNQYSRSGAFEADNPENDYFNETIKRYNAGYIEAMESVINILTEMSKGEK